MVRTKNSEKRPPKKRQSSKAESRSSIQLTETKDEATRRMFGNAKKFHKVKRRILTTFVTSLMLKNRIDELVEQATDEITLTEDARRRSESQSKEMDQSLGEVSGGNQRKDAPEDSE